MSWIPWIQRISFVVLFVVSIVLGAYSNTWSISIAYLICSIILMGIAFCTQRLKWISGFFFICLLFFGLLMIYFAAIYGYDYNEGSTTAARFNCFILIIITTLLFHYYYTQWRYSDLIQLDSFDPSNGRVHVLYFWHSVFLLIASSIMFIVNACFANYFSYFVFFNLVLLSYQLAMSKEQLELSLAFQVKKEQESTIVPATIVHCVPMPQQQDYYKHQVNQLRLLLQFTKIISFYQFGIQFLEFSL